MPPVPESPFKPRSPFSPFSPFWPVPVGKERTQAWLGTATPPRPHLCAPGKGKAAGITSRGDPQRLLRPDPLGLLQGPPATPRAAAPRHGGGGDGDSVHQPWDTLCQQRGDTVAPRSASRKGQVLGHHQAPHDLGHAGHSALLIARISGCNTCWQQLTSTLPEGCCPPSIPLPKSPETCLRCRRGEG